MGLSLRYLPFRFLDSSVSRLDHRSLKSFGPMLLPNRPLPATVLPANVTPSACVTKIREPASTPQTRTAYCQPLSCWACRNRLFAHRYAGSGTDKQIGAVHVLDGVSIQYDIAVAPARYGVLVDRRNQLCPAPLALPSRRHCVTYCYGPSRCGL